MNNHLLLFYLDGALANTDDSSQRQQQSSTTHFSKRKASFR